MRPSTSTNHRRSRASSGDELQLMLVTGSRLAPQKPPTDAPMFSTNSLWLANDHKGTQLKRHAVKQDFRRCLLTSAQLYPVHEEVIARQGVYEEFLAFDVSEDDKVCMLYIEAVLAIGCF